MNTPDLRRGFTLIEMLVVITIIGLLAALLFPVFAKARERAHQSVCESNLHQIGLAIQMYQSDNGGTLPENFEALSNYKSDHRLYLCPDADQQLATSYLYRVDSLLSFDPAEPEETPGKMLHPDSGTVLVICDSHVSDKWKPAQSLGSFIVLRAGGSVSEAEAKQAVQWSYNGRWYAPGVTAPVPSSIWTVFPGEPWPPQFEK